MIWSKINNEMGGPLSKHLSRGRSIKIKGVVFKAKYKIIKKLLFSLWRERIILKLSPWKGPKKKLSISWRLRIKSSRRRKICYSHLAILYRLLLCTFRSPPTRKPRLTFIIKLSKKLEDMNSMLCRSKLMYGRMLPKVPQKSNQS